MPLSHLEMTPSAICFLSPMIFDISSENFISVQPLDKRICLIFFPTFFLFIIP